MTSWLSKSTLQKLLNLAGLHYTTSERPLLFLGWTTAMLFWLDFLQTQSNLYKWFRMLQHDWSSANPKGPTFTPLFISLHWLPVAARIKFKTLNLTYITATGSAPAYFHSLLWIYIPPEVSDLLVNDALWYHHRETQNHFPERFRSPFLAGWMIFQPLSRMLIPWQY